jgi:hypothetical protein
MKTRTTFTLFLTAILTLAAGSAFGKYSGGSGTAGAPYRIATKTDLLALAANTGDYNKCFIQTADINMTGQVFAKAIIAPNTDSGTSFLGTYFTGTFDGNDHKITNFTIKDIVNNSFIGLFGYIFGGSVKNLGIEDCSVSGYYYLGCLAGYNNGGNISDCHSTGSVSGVSSSFSVGGLVGYNSGTISDCYSTGSVSGVSDASYIGGLVGINNSNISNCYSAGAVSGYWRVGGLAGYNNYGSISNCYSMGAVSGSSVVGGLVGFQDGGSIVSSFWDVNTSGQPTSAGGIGMTSAQMKRTSTFGNWDFIETWGIIENQTYPYLGLTGDLNHDKKVDFKDFAIFADNWLAGE